MGGLALLASILIGFISLAILINYGSRNTLIIGQIEGRIASFALQGRKHEKTLLIVLYTVTDLFYSITGGAGAGK